MMRKTRASSLLQLSLFAGLAGVSTSPGSSTGGFATTWARQAGWERRRRGSG